MGSIPRLLPAKHSNRNIVEQLTETIASAEALYASVAFWTIGTAYLPGLAELLSAPGSFFCVDLRGKTKVNSLMEFYQAGAKLLYLFIRKVTNSSDLAFNRHLLHTKMLLFDLPYGQAELWIGSHNFTKYALAGGNREASLVLTLSQDSKLYTQAKDYLLAIRSECYQFDPTLLDQYKQLQGEENEDIDLECYVLGLFWNSKRHHHGQASLSDQTALLLSRSTVVGSRLDKLYFSKNPLLVWAYDLATGDVSYWNARVQNAGRIDETKSSSDIQYGHPLLAILEGGTLPYLAPKKQDLSQPLLRNFKNTASIWLYENVTNSLILTPPPSPLTKADWIRDELATTELRDAIGRAADTPETSSDNKPVFRNLVDGEANSALNAQGWLQGLEEEAIRRHRHRSRARLSGIIRQPIVMKPVFDVPKPVETHDPLRQLHQSLTKTDRAAIRQHYELPLRIKYFGELTMQSSFEFSGTALPDIEMANVIIKYHLLIRQE